MITDWTLLVAAYAVMWVVLFGYVIWVLRRQEALQREVEALRKALEARDEGL